VDRDEKLIFEYKKIKLAQIQALLTTAIEEKATATEGEEVIEEKAVVVSWRSSWRRPT
jgi:hypothetical protein